MEEFNQNSSAKAENGPWYQQFYHDFMHNRSGDVSYSNCRTGNITIAEEEKVVTFNNSGRKVFSRLTKRVTKVSSTMERLRVIPARGKLCVEGLGHNYLGSSRCDITIVLNHALPPLFIASQSTYFVCGPNAYLWLPRGWSGSYLAFLLPPTYVAPPAYHLQYHRKRRSMPWLRTGRSINVVDQTDTTLQQYIDFNMGFFSYVGAALNSRSIRRLSRIIEAVVNETTVALGNITAELQATRLVTLHNCMFLDVILADRGGACRALGSSCCVYIPDNAPTAYQAIEKLHKIAAEVHQETGT